MDRHCDRTRRRTVVGPLNRFVGALRSACLRHPAPTGESTLDLSAVDEAVIAAGVRTDNCPKLATRRTQPGSAIGLSGWRRDHASDVPGL